MAAQGTPYLKRGRTPVPEGLGNEGGADNTTPETKQKTEMPPVVPSVPSGSPPSREGVDDVKEPSPAKVRPLKFGKLRIVDGDELELLGLTFSHPDHLLITEAMRSQTVDTVPLIRAMWDVVKDSLPGSIRQGVS